MQTIEELESKIKELEKKIKISKQSLEQYKLIKKKYSEALLFLKKHLCMFQLG